MKTIDFFTITDGKTAKLYSLRNTSGFGADISDWGGTIVRLFAPDRNKNLRDVILGFADPADYRKNKPYFGALIGRYANRIANGFFDLDGKTYELPHNHSGGKHCLHGGLGYSHRLWEAVPQGENRLELNLFSPDGDAGFPGALKVKVVYEVTEKNELLIDYRAEAETPTVVNLTNHSYFDLDGEGALDCSAHVAEIHSSAVTEENETQTITGKQKPLKGTVLDLNRPRSFAEILAGTNGLGADHNYILDHGEGKLKNAVAKIYSPKSGISLTLSTTLPGVQFYMARFLDGSARGKSGKNYGPFSAFCLETQYWPDSVHFPQFPSTRLEPGEIYKHRTIFAFGVEKA